MLVTYCIGGQVTRTQIEDIMNRVKAMNPKAIYAPHSLKSIIDGPNIDFDKMVVHLIIDFDADYVLLGAFEEFEEYLNSQQIPFDVWRGPDDGQSAVLVCYRPGKELREYKTDSEGDPYITRTEFDKIAISSLTKEELIDKVMEKFPEYADPLPELTIG